MIVLANGSHIIQVTINKHRTEEDYIKNDQDAGLQLRDINDKNWGKPDPQPIGLVLKPKIVYIDRAYQAEVEITVLGTLNCKPHKLQKNQKPTVSELSIMGRKTNVWMYVEEGYISLPERFVARTEHRPLSHEFHTTTETKEQQH